MSAGTLSTGPGTNGRGSPARPRSLQLTWLVASREIRLRANSEIILKQVPLGGVTGSVATLAQLAGLSRLIQAVPGAAPADLGVHALLHGDLRQRGEQVLPRARLPPADRADR